MAVEAKHVSRTSTPGAWRPEDFDDPTEDLSRALAEGVEPAAPAGQAPVMPDPAPDPFEPGRVLAGRYELERVVGRGGFSVVLGAFDLRRRAAGDADAHVAIKALRPESRHDAGARGRLTAEFRQLQQLSHPGIVRVYDLDRQGEDWFLVMELLEGTSLAALLKQADGEPLPRSRALEILRACADALGWAHGRGIVHGDVKPGNVFVTSGDGVRLLDFVAPSVPGAGETATGERTGQFATPAYASPQVLQGRQPEARDDVYSLACVAFEMLAGLHPFDRADAREAWASGMHAVDTPRLHPGLRDALLAGLAFDRERRPASMGEFVRRLSPSGAAGDPVGAGTAPAAAASPPDRRHAWWLAGAAVVTAVVAATALSGRDTAPVARDDARSAPPAVLPPAGSPSDDDALSAAEEPAAPPGADVAVEQAVEASAAQPPRPEAAAPTPPPPRQRVAFAAGSVVASRTAPAAAIPVRRSGGSDGRTVVAWRIDEGSARAGRDFAGPLSGTLVLADGQQGGTVFVPLVGGVEATEDRRFGVLIDGVRGPARAGAATRVEVTLRSFVPDRARSLVARD